MDIEEPSLAVEKPRFIHVPRGTLMPRYDARRRATKGLVRIKHESIFDDVRKLVVAFWPNWANYGEGWLVEIRLEMKAWLHIFNYEASHRANFVRSDKIHIDQAYLTARAAMRFSSRRVKDGQSHGAQRLKTKRKINPKSEIP